MTATMSTVARVASTLSGVRNALSGQSKNRARLNAISAYDCSNELYMVGLNF